GRRKTLAGLRLPEMQEGRACGAALPARHGVRHFSVMSFLLFLLPEAGTPSAPGCLAASGRRPDSDRQLLAHPPVSAEPAGAVSGCRYGPMSEKPGLQRPFRSRRPCRAGNGAPCTPDGV
ncbi:hypothetical protein ACJEDW_24840, partial [Escherichia coli]